LLARYVNDESLGRHLDELLAVAELLELPAERIGQPCFLVDAELVLAAIGARLAEGLLEYRRQALLRDLALGGSLVHPGRIELRDTLRETLSELVHIFTRNATEQFHVVSRVAFRRLCSASGFVFFTQK